MLENMGMFQQERHLDMWTLLGRKDIGVGQKWT